MSETSNTPASAQQTPQHDGGSPPSAVACQAPESGTSGTAGNQTDSVAEQASWRASELAEPFREKAGEFADQQKTVGADQIEGVAGVVHRAADDLGRQMPQAAGAIHEAAAGLERVSTSLRRSSINDLVGSVEDFARKQPAAFFGATVLAGFALSRFLKSSAPDEAGAGRSANRPGSGA